MSRLMSRWSSSLVIAVTLLLGTLSGTPAHVDDLNLCKPSAQRPVLISLPADEAPHVVHDEWYYTTGHLRTPSGRRYGFETVVFQLTDPSSGGFITVGQIAVTDLNNRTFHHETYLVPGSFPVSTHSFHVTLPQGLTMSGGHGSIDITASLPDGYGIDLRLESVKNPVYQASDGLIRYIDPLTGQQIATQFYYSRPRMATFGSVTSPTGTEVAFGQSWFDHAYGTLPLPINWEWFSIQLDDGREIMAYNLRDPRTQNTYAKFGSIQDSPPGCHVQSLGASDFTMALQGAWISPHTGITYPNQLGLSVPSRGMHLTLTPELADQEVYKPAGVLRVLPPYWEGTVKVSGTVNGRPVSGSGYVEMLRSPSP
jgi:predicted secreted hydrolase